MSGLFISSVPSGRLNYYFNSIATGLEDHRLVLEPDDIEGIGEWSGLESDAGLVQIYSNLKNLASNGRFVHKISNLGFDLCFVAPKQISVMFALLPEGNSKDIVEAHRSSVRAVLEQIESDLGYQGSNQLNGIGFLHYSSRSLDPHLHTHLVVENRSTDQGGRFRAINSSKLYSDVQRYSILYRKTLGREIYARLGLLMIENQLTLEGGPTQVPKFPEDLAKLFSKRADHVSKLMKEWGTVGMNAARSASLITREDKQHISVGSLKQRWQTEFNYSGFGSNVVEQLISPQRWRQVRPLYGNMSKGTDDVMPEFLSRLRDDTGILGKIDVVCFENDVIARQQAFSIAPIVGVVAGRYERPGLNSESLAKYLATSNLCEIIGVGKCDWESVAKVANRHRFQELVIASDIESIRNASLEISSALKYRIEPFLPKERSELIAMPMPMPMPMPMLKDKDVDIRIDIASGKRLSHTIDEFIVETENSLKGVPACRHLILGSKFDRDLVRRKISNELGLTTGEGGFFAGELVWIKYLPKRYGLDAPRAGRINSTAEGLEYLDNERTINVSFEELKVPSMLMPLEILSVSDFRRIFNNQVGPKIGLGESATYNSRSKSLSLFLHAENARSLVREMENTRKISNQLDPVFQSLMDLGR